MTKRLSSFVLLLLLLPLLLMACNEQKKTTSTPVVEAKKAMVLSSVLKASIRPQVVETTGDALPLWRSYRGNRPTLLLFSNKPLLPIPSQIRADADRLLAGNDTELIRRTARPVADQLLHPFMAVGAALQNGYFERVIWVVPVTADRKLVRDVLIRQMEERSPEWGRDLQSFVAQDNRLSGTLANIPVDIVTIDHLPPITAPLLVHIDSGYFQPFYKGEIKTPLYDLLRSQLRLLAAQNYQGGVVTVSRDNQFENLPLATRFISTEIASFFIDPKKLEESNPLEALRTEALFLENFMQSEKIVTNYQQLQQASPNDASVHFGAYLALRRVRKGQEALAALQQAVLLDPGYAYEYLELAGTALQKNLPGNALEMLALAAAAQPDDPLVVLQQAELLLFAGKKAEAVVLLQKLAALPWSDVTYPQMRQRIKGMLEKADK